jgi:hypothetical protein
MFFSEEKNQKTLSVGGGGMRPALADALPRAQ